MIKQCRQCKRILSLQDFHADSKSPDGRRGICKACAVKRSAASRGKITRQYGGLVDVYYNIMKRCYDRSNPSYPRYGARGIRMCDEWKNDRQAFFDWSMTHGYRPKLELDRINNDGNYEPKNCRYVSRAENQHNTSKTKLNEKTVAIIRSNNISRRKTQTELAEELGVSQSRISKICLNQSWTVKRKRK